MEKVKEAEWHEAQKIVISKDLVAAAKQQLNFLAAVDRNRDLYHGPALGRAICRYKYCWLPLLAKYTETAFSEAPLVVPLDCEWIWHCHRLNPVRYKIDCEKLYGRILDNVVSSIEGTCTKYTEEIWNKIYPNEPYEFETSTFGADDEARNILGHSETTTTTNYDLVSAVKRQIPFFYQVSRPYMSCDDFLEGAVARYKGFLHMIKRNKEMSIKSFCVPTYDIDLIWHSHQLSPAAYFKDMVTIVGKVLNHDDTDSDRTKGGKLDVSFYETTKQWEVTYGSRYLRAGVMYRGKAPSSLSMNLSNLQTSSLRKKAAILSNKEYPNMVQLPKRMLIEVVLEIAAVRDLPSELVDKISILFGKKQPDSLFKNRGRMLNIVAKSKEKQVYMFQCEPTGEIVLELVSSSPSRVLGTRSITLQDYLTAASKLPVEISLDSNVNSGVLGSKPVSVVLSLSLTPPVTAPYVLHMVPTRPSLKNSGFFSASGRSQNAKSWTCVADEAGNEIMRIQLRDLKEEAKEKTGNHLGKKEVIGVTPSGEAHVLAKLVGAEEWSLMNSDWSFSQQNKLTGCSHKVIMIPGRKLEYENKICVKGENEKVYMTAVEFSTEYPYGKAVALLNLKFGSIEIKEEWLLLPGITSAFLLTEIYSAKDKVMNMEEETKKKYSGYCENENEVQDSDAGSDYGDGLVKHGNNYEANWVRLIPCGGYEDGHWNKDRATGGGFGVYSAICGGCKGDCSGAACAGCRAGCGVYGAICGGCNADCSSAACAGCRAGCGGGGGCGS